MEKLVYVLWKRDHSDEEDFKAQMLGDVAKRVIELGVHALSMNLVDEHVASCAQARITKLDPPISGTISFWLDSADERGRYEELLGRVTSRSAGYLVVESVPLVNTTHHAPLRERTPGTNMVTCIEKPERLSQEAWIEHWHGHHRQVALETQCTYAYVRNVVVRPLTDGAPPWAGIVEEGFPSEAVTDPMLWYCADGSPETLQRNRKRMIESVQTFLDLDRVESHPMSEYPLLALS